MLGSVKKELQFAESGSADQSAKFASFMLIQCCSVIQNSSPAINSTFTRITCDFH